MELSGDFAIMRPCPGAIHVGAIEVRPHARAILVSGRPVELGGRAFDLLMALLEARGEIVSKADLLRRVWPTVTIIDSNLKVQLSMLRRALGAERWRIKTISGRGYLLIADDDAPPAPTATPLPPPRAGSQPMVFLIEAAPPVQAVFLQALSELANSFGGSARLAFVKAPAR